MHSAYPGPSPPIRYLTPMGTPSRSRRARAFSRRKLLATSTHSPDIPARNSAQLVGASVSACSRMGSVSPSYLSRSGCNIVGCNSIERKRSSVRCGSRAVRLSRKFKPPRAWGRRPMVEDRSPRETGLPFRDDLRCRRCDYSLPIQRANDSRVRDQRFAGRAGHRSQRCALEGSSCTPAPTPKSRSQSSERRQGRAPNRTG